MKAVRWVFVRMITADPSILQFRILRLSNAFYTSFFCVYQHMLTTTPAGKTSHLQKRPLTKHSSEGDEKVSKTSKKHSQYQSNTYKVHNLLPCFDFQRRRSHCLWLSYPKRCCVVWCQWLDVPLIYSNALLRSSDLQHAGIHINKTMLQAMCFLATASACMLNALCFVPSCRQVVVKRLYCVGMGAWKRSNASKLLRPKEPVRACARDNTHRYLFNIHHIKCRIPHIPHVGRITYLFVNILSQVKVYLRASYIQPLQEPHLIFQTIKLM